MRGVNFRRLTTLPTEAPTDHVRLYANDATLEVVDDEGTVTVLGTAAVPQVIPATPTPQDIADALKAAWPDVFTQTP